MYTFTVTMKDGQVFQIKAFGLVRGSMDDHSTSKKKDHTCLFVRPTKTTAVDAAYITDHASEILRVVID